MKRRIASLQIFAACEMLQGFWEGDGLGTGRLYVVTLTNKMSSKPPPPECLETSHNSQNLSPPPAQAGGHPARPGLGYGTDLYSHSAGLIRLCAVIDWFSPRFLTWPLSTTIETAICIEAAEEALGRYRKPGIFNTDQGLHRTSMNLTAVKAEVAISNDGRGAWGQRVCRTTLAVDQVL